MVQIPKTVFIKVHPTDDIPIVSQKIYPNKEFQQMNENRKNTKTNGNLKKKISQIFLQI